MDDARRDTLSAVPIPYIIKKMFGVKKLYKTDFPNRVFLNRIEVQ